MLEHLLKANRAWAEARIREDPHYFERLSSLQAPDYLWIGCSDSRVPANVITGLEPGEVFVHRNVANQVYAHDFNCMSVVQFALEVLKVKHVIVCGHYGCGGIHAAVDGERHGLIDHWIRPIRDIAETNAAELEALDEAHRHDRLCEMNVQAQVANLARSPFVEDAWARGQELTLHGWLYSLQDGHITDLQCSRSG